MKSNDPIKRSLLRVGITALLAAPLLLALPTPPAGAQTVGGLGQRGRGGEDNTPRPAPAPPPPAPEPKPDPPKQPDPPRQPDPPPAPAPDPPAPVPAPEAPPAPPPPVETPKPAPRREARPAPPPDPTPDAREAPRRDRGPDAEAGPARSLRITTPVGQRPVPRPSDDGNYLYSPPVIVEVPVEVAYPVPVEVPDVPVYTAPPQPFPSVPATAPPQAVLSAPAPQALGAGRIPAGTSTAAFADIERAWTRGDLSRIRRHVRAGDTKIAVSLRGRYAYSLTADDFLRITRTALGRLATVSFRFTRLRRATNGDVTAYGRHVYRMPAVPPTGGKRDANPAAPPLKTVFVSYTLRHRGDVWDIVRVDSSPTDLVEKAPARAGASPGKAPFRRQ